VFYSLGGCWNLPLALHAATGLAIEVAYRGGAPVHAYVADETHGVDVYGLKPLRSARAGFEGTRRVTPAELLQELARGLSPAWVVEVESEDMRMCAEAAAAVLLDALGWQGLRPSDAAA
jgi:hypothetical protein